ncbi:MAG: hypothetical protein EXS32_03285 [Opitutus sp.]|nr:hypothetical protein [Opitutus sp.]
MNENFLQDRLQRVIRRHQWLGLSRKLALGWAVAAVAGMALLGLERATGWTSTFTLPALAGLATMLVTALTIRHFETTPDHRWAANKIEEAHPELNGVLLTAVQQRLTAGREPGYLQHRVLQEAMTRSREQDWHKVVPTARLAWTHAAHAVALGCFLVALSGVRVTSTSRAPTPWLGADGITVTPGDTSIERGDSLVVLARFGRTLPATVTLVVRENAVPARTIPLVKSLADPVFGGSVPEVASDFTYHLEYRGQRTRDFKVAVYEHPRLVRADADLAFPGYTKLPKKHIEDTRRISAVEGTKLDYALQLNKPVASAKLVTRGVKKTEIPLQVVPGQAVAKLPAFVLAASQAYDLQLVDADGRKNKISAPFIIDVQPNRPPELRLASPRGDVRPSALEEIAFEGTVFDDFGSPAYGLAYAVAGGETKFIELGKNTGAKEKRPFSYLLKLEEIGVKPDDLVSWYAWADDLGPDGKLRRTSSDLFFGEVRPFDEIFRESQGMQTEEQQQQQQQSGQGNQSRRLTELQKQIINATWKLQRDGATPKYADDAAVVHDSQKQALEQAEETAGNARSPRETALWGAATKEMELALEKLAGAAKSPANLASALPAEQAAYQALLKLQARETNVARNRSRSRGQGGQGQQANQRQIDQLDLTQAENRYETQRQAQAPKSTERQEQLQVMNRLQELARRQQDINERLKELQTSLQEAHTEQERADLRHRLKRLQEEQQQMLADADEVRQRMDRPENQAQMSQEREQLEQTRSELQKASEAAAQGSVAQALAAGTRAQRQLQQMRDDLRKENSSQFADELREMRGEARELAREQEQIGQKLDELGGAQRKTLSDTVDRAELSKELAQQKERLNKLVDRATQISEQAENTEPLITRQLYDSIRKLNQDDANSVKEAKQELLNRGMLTRDLNDRLKKTEERASGGKVLDLASEMLRLGYLPQAGQAGRRARGEIDELRRGVERAAESVLGDDAEQLKLAQSELDALTDQLRREIAQAAGDAAPGGESRPGAATGDQRQAGTPPPEGGNQPGQAPGEGEPSAASPGRDGQQPGPGGQPSGQRGQQPGQRGGAVANNTRGGARNGPGARGGGLNVDDILNGGVDNRGATDRGGVMGGNWNGGPLTGGDFGPWTERLRNVEELLDTPELRNAVATARERARLFRRDVAQTRTKPDWTVVRLQILKPLVEVRSRVAEELARHDSKDSLAPIDRDPVPTRFAESVRRYYEELGKDK